MNNNLQKLKEAIRNKKLVVVVGAGISKDSPSNLPSWWDYNILLLEQIGLRGAKAVNKKESLLNIQDIISSISVTSISGLFYNYVAGNSYLPLLSLLDSAEPNIHHYMLADLYKKEVLQGIITTNFDTLIEKAFSKKNIPCSVIKEPNGFYKTNDDNCKIYKIHGSADNTDFAIDTIYQKIQGFTEEQKHIMQNLFENNHILFLGFSGEDFLINTDYIPIKANKKSGLGITWVSYPGSMINEEIKEILYNLDANIIETTLDNLYDELSLKIEVIDIVNKTNRISFKQKAVKKINKLLKSNHIGDLGCLGLCIQILICIGKKDEANKIASPIIKKIINKRIYNGLEASQMIPLLTSLVILQLENNNPKLALNITNLQLKLLSLLQSEIEDENNYFQKSTLLRISTVLNWQGTVIHNEFNDFDTAYSIFLNAFEAAYKSRSFENMSSILLNFANLEYFASDNSSEKEHADNIIKYIKMVNASKRLAKKAGSAQQIFNCCCCLATIYTDIGNKKVAQEKIKEAEHYMKLCFSTDNSKKLSFLILSSDKIEQKSDVNDETIRNVVYELPQHIWEPYGQRNALIYDEAITAKNLLETGDFSQAQEILSQAINKYVAFENYEAAEALSDCLAGIYIHHSNIEQSDIKFLLMEMALKAYNVGLQCQIRIGRFEYLAQTLGSIAMLNYNMFKTEEATADILFYSELCLALEDNPHQCWQIVLAAYLECKIYFEQQKYPSALKYCTMALDFLNENPEAINQYRIDELKAIYKTIVAILK